MSERPEREVALSKFLDLCALLRFLSVQLVACGPPSPTIASSALSTDATTLLPRPRPQLQQPPSTAVALFLARSLVRSLARSLAHLLPSVLPCFSPNSLFPGRRRNTLRTFYTFFHHRFLRRVLLRRHLGIARNVRNLSRRFSATDFMESSRVESTPGFRLRSQLTSLRGASGS